MPSPVRWLLPVGSAAALLLVMVVTIQVNRQSHQPSVGSADAQMARINTVDDLEIVTADADIDLLKDMDFYAWLDTQNLNSSTSEGGAG